MKTEDLVEKLYWEKVELLGALSAALEALEGAKGNINPERGFADEVEAEIFAAMTRGYSVLVKVTRIEA